MLEILNYKAVYPWNVLRVTYSKLNPWNGLENGWH